MRLSISRATVAVVFSAAIGATPGTPPVSAAARCESLSTRPPNATVTTATAVTGGSFTLPGAQRPMAGLPDFCRISGVIKPTPSSEIVFETWLPLEKWNQKFSAVGNGGWAGNILFGQLADQIRRGYATAATNTGHEAAAGFGPSEIRVSCFRSDWSTLRRAQSTR